MGWEAKIWPWWIVLRLYQGLIVVSNFSRFAYCASYQLVVFVVRVVIFVKFLFDYRGKVSIWRWSVVVVSCRQPSLGLVDPNLAHGPGAVTFQLDTARAKEIHHHCSTVAPAVSRNIRHKAILR